MQPNVTFEYSITMRKSISTMPFVTNKTLYEIHGAFKITDLDVEKWTQGKDKVQFRFGLYWDRLIAVDWLLIDLVYDTEKTTEEILSCTDGYSDMKS